MFLLFFCFALLFWGIDILMWDREGRWRASCGFCSCEEGGGWVNRGSHSASDAHEGS